MSKQLYEEALADARQLKEVAEDNAKRALVEAVTPRIREMIENELLREFYESEDKLDQSETDDSDVLTDVELQDETGTDFDSGSNLVDDSAQAISVPDAEGKVTLDLDAMNIDDAGTSVDAPMFGTKNNDDEYEINFESISKLMPIIKSSKFDAKNEFETSVRRFGEQLQTFKAASKIVKESRGYSNQINRMISNVENMYDYVQESISDSTKKNLYETILEMYFKELNKLQERKMSKKSLKDLLNEGDVTLKLTGLPDDVDLDSVGVDLVSGEDGVEDSDDLDLDLDSDDAESQDDGNEDEDEDESDSGGDDDLDLDLDSDSQDDDDQVGESNQLSDNTMVEIDEGMLRREISRMKKLRENAALFEKDDMDLDEADDVVDDDVDQVVESDDDSNMDEFVNMDEAEDEREYGGNVANKSTGQGAQTRKQSRSPGHTVESLERKIQFEKRLQERTKMFSNSLKKEAANTNLDKNSLSKNVKMRSSLQRRFSESVARMNHMTKMLTESKSNKSVNQNGNTTQLTEKANKNLRNKLTESNLFNAKLVYTNKLLQNEALSKKQKAEIIERLDEANNLREVTVIYESLTKILAGTSRPLTEGNDRKVIGSSSRATRPASTPLNEGYETNRWARLAGIK